jgi:hypothetical protein
VRVRVRVRSSRTQKNRLGIAEAVFFLPSIASRESTRRIVLFFFPDCLSL